MSPAGHSTYHACARTNKLNPEDEIVMSKSSPTRHIENSLNAQRAKTFPRMNPGRRSLLKRAAQLPDPRLKPQHLRPQQQGYPISKKWRQPKLETSNFRVFSFFFPTWEPNSSLLGCKVFARLCVRRPRCQWFGSDPQLMRSLRVCSPLKPLTLQSLLLWCAGIGVYMCPLTE